MFQEDYIRAKARLFSNQQAFDWAIVQHEALLQLQELGVKIPSKVISFSASGESDIQQPWVVQDSLSWLEIILRADREDLDTVVEWIYRYARAARLVDGASEVHGMVLARHYAKLGNEFWRWGSEQKP